MSNKYIQSPEMISLDDTLCKSDTQWIKDEVPEDDISSNENNGSCNVFVPNMLQVLQDGRDINSSSKEAIGIHHSFTASSIPHLQEEPQHGDSDKLPSDETRFNVFGNTLSVSKSSYFQDGIPHYVSSDVSSNHGNVYNLSVPNVTHLSEGTHQDSSSNIQSEEVNEDEYTLSTPNMTDTSEKVHVEHQSEENLSKLERQQVINKLNSKCTDKSKTKDRKQHKCNVCDRRYTRTRDLVRHSKNAHSEEYPFGCNICGLVYQQKSMLYCHLENHNSKKKHACYLCEDIFFRIRDLQTHFKEKHPEVDRPFECEICKKCFKTKQNLQNHKQMHSEDKKYYCGVCGRNFGKPSNLKVHLRVHFKAALKNNPAPSGEQRTECEKVLQDTLGIPLDYKCDTCGNVYSSKYILKMHKKVHTGDFKCEFCGLELPNNSTLQGHRRIHTGRTTYECNVCGIVFNSSHNLKIHTVVHTGEKPYKCDVCQKLFSFKNSLKAHLKIHSGEKNYKCDICTKEFKLSYSLVLHKRTHSGERNYKCDMCEKAFYSYGNLSYHKKQVHEKKAKRAKNNDQRETSHKQASS